MVLGPMHILLQRRCLRPAAARRCSNMTHFHLVRRASWFPNSKQCVLVCKLAVHATNRLPNRCHPTERNVAVSWPQEQNKASFGAQKRGHVFDTVLNAGPLGGPIFGSGFRPQKRDRKMQKKSSPFVAARRNVAQSRAACAPTSHTATLARCLSTRYGRCRFMSCYSKPSMFLYGCALRKRPLVGAFAILHFLKYKVSCSARVRTSASG